MATCAPVLGKYNCSFSPGIFNQAFVNRGEGKMASGVTRVVSSNVYKRAIFCIRTVSSRRFSTELPPLNQPLDGINETPTKFLKNHTPLDSSEVRVTTLSNGMKIASENSFGQFSTIGGMFPNVKNIFLYFILPYYP